MSKKLRHIALFGGTFDPVHQGHLEVALATKQHFPQIEEIYFIPCAQSPDKENPPHATAEQRFHMLQLALKDYPNFKIDLFETLNTPPSYTLHTLQEFHKQFPRARLYWILGADQWNIFTTWTFWEEICQQSTIIVCQRNNALLKLYPNIDKLVVQSNHPASSTTIRKNQYPSSWLNPSVQHYIYDQKLYPSFKT